MPVRQRSLAPMPAHASSPCGYCRSTTSRPLLACADTTGHPWFWRTCLECGAVFLAPRPTADQLAAAYGTQYYGKSDTKFIGLEERFMVLCRNSRARRLAKLLPTGGSILDLGCGNGGFLSALGRRGAFRLSGIELKGASACRAASRPEIALKIGPLQAGTYPPDSFDLVTLFHVFEHLPEPRETLAIIHRILKPGGRLVMSFPNISSTQARIFRAAWLHLDPPRHLFLMPPRAFERATDSLGFRVERVRFASIEQNPYAFVQSLLNTVLRDRDVLYERLKGNLGYAPQHGRLSLLAQKTLAAALFPFAVGLDACEGAFGRAATVEFTLTKKPIVAL